MSPDIKQCRMNGDILEVELYSGLKQGWVSGTAVRMHTGGAKFVYGYGGVIGNTWQEIVMNHNRHPLRSGTNSVKIVIRCCSDLKEQNGLCTATGSHPWELTVHSQFAMGEIAINDPVQIDTIGNRWFWRV
jgi:hypothetical protein